MPARRPILLVDDDEDLRATLVEQFAGEPSYSVSTAATLDEAAAAINAKGPLVDAVILDVGMPDGDGCDLCAYSAGRAIGCPSSC